MHIIDDAERHHAEQQWLNGGSALPLVSLLASRNMNVEASAVARVALARPECPDAEKLEELLDTLSETPEDWQEMLDGFCAAPTIERWRELMQFVPPESIYLRQRSAIRNLRKRGIEGNLLFLCACEWGLTPDAIELVEEGLVRPETLVERGERAGAARATYFGLAAEAAYLAGDFLGTIRLLRDSLQHESEWCSAAPHVAFIRERASKTENEALDRAGIPAW
jgi:hypothetical protein